MDIAQPQTKVKAMGYGLRPMHANDVRQMIEMEKDAFPTLWPPTPYKRDLNNSMIAHLVSWRTASVEDPPHVPDPASNPQLKPHLINRFLSSVRNPWMPKEKPEGPADFLTGFVSIWFMVDDAHITAIGVREVYRGRGIGELLIIGAIELVMACKFREITLEVRVSNHVAQSLYHKYGFTQVGLRKRYYTDNNEDAFIMSATSILDPPYPENFQHLVLAHKERWGENIRVLS